MSRELRASNRKDTVILVDDDLYEAIIVFKWRIDNKGYPVRTIYPDPGNKRRRTKLTLHRFVMGAPPKPLVTDHINRNKLDNRRENLRFVTNAQNIRNSSRVKNQVSGGSGIRKRKTRWSAYIYVRRRQVHLGMFDSESAARSARNAAIFSQKGGHDGEAFY